MKYKAIIFDMDGTVIDTEHIWKTVTKELLQKRSIILDHHAYQQLDGRIAGATTSQICALLKETFNLPDEVHVLVKEKSEAAAALYSKHVTLMRGFAEFYKKVQKYNLKVALATNADDTSLKITNQILNLQTYFGGHMYNLSHVNNVGKPKPDLYLHAASQIDVDPTLCIAIEDSAHGIKAARDAGLFCIGLDSSRRPAQMTESNMVVQEYDEIDLESILKK
jgi:HAD superfamily hydrolase (TIGR01509 family)